VACWSTSGARKSAAASSTAASSGRTFRSVRRDEVSVGGERRGADVFLFPSFSFFSTGRCFSPVSYYLYRDLCSMLLKI
jgi:hypothetical protein